MIENVKMWLVKHTVYVFEKKMCHLNVYLEYSNVLTLYLIVPDLFNVWIQFNTFMFKDS